MPTVERDSNARATSRTRVFIAVQVQKLSFSEKFKMGSQLRKGLVPKVDVYKALEVVSKRTLKFIKKKFVRAHKKK